MPLASQSPENLPENFIRRTNLLMLASVLTNGAGMVLSSAIHNPIPAIVSTGLQAPLEYVITRRANNATRSFETQQEGTHGAIEGVDYIRHRQAFVAHLLVTATSVINTIFACLPYLSR